MPTQVLILSPGNCYQGQIEDDLDVVETVRNRDSPDRPFPKKREILEYAARISDLDFRFATYSEVPEEEMRRYSLEVKSNLKDIAQIYYCDPSSEAGSFYGAGLRDESNACSVEDFLLEFNIPALPVPMDYDDFFRRARISTHISLYESVLGVLAMTPRVIYRNGGLVFPDDHEWLSEAIGSARAELLKYIARYPSRVFDVTPREFELLIAAIFKEAGFTVELTPATRDGGFDVLAIESSKLVGQTVYLIECKRYAENRKVGIGAVQRLVGAVDEKTADRGLLVTTSRFSSDAQRSAEANKRKIRLMDYDDLVGWLEGVTGNTRGAPT